MVISSTDDTFDGRNDQQKWPNKHIETNPTPLARSSATLLPSSCLQRALWCSLTLPWPQRRLRPATIWWFPGWLTTLHISQMNGLHKWYTVRICLHIFWYYRITPSYCSSGSLITRALYLQPFFSQGHPFDAHKIWHLDVGDRYSNYLTTQLKYMWNIGKLESKVIPGTPNSGTPLW